MASPGGFSRLDTFTLTVQQRPSIDLGRQMSRSSSIPEENFTHTGITLPLGIPPPEPGFITADDSLAAAAAAAANGDSLTQPLLPQSQAAGDAAAAAGAEQVPFLYEKEAAGARAEAGRLMKLAVPLALQSIASMLTTFISTTFVGHLNDPLALSAVVLSSSLFNVTGISITIGLASAMDTLCGQAYGARRYAMLGVVLQRARLICWCAAIPVAVLWNFMGPLLLLLGQDADLSRLAGINMQLLIPALFFGVVNDTTRRYLVSQRAVFPTSCCYLLTTALSPLYNWIFIYRMGLGVKGAAYAITCCTATNSLLLIAYQTYRDAVLLKGTPQATWSGYSTAAFRGWGQYLSLGLPAAAMICLEWWVWELLIFAAGLLPSGSVAVGVMGLCIQITNPSYMIPSSFGSATSVRVANLLGAGQGLQARTAARVSAAIVFTATLLLGCCTFAGRHAVVRIFTDDPTIRAATAAVVPAVATSIVGDGMVAVLSAVLRASGRQAIGAMFNIAGYWCVCLPLAWLLGFHLQLGVLGFWIALTLATAMQAAAFGILISRFDWKAEVKRAAALTAAHQATH